ncbi:uncharacterized protein LOC118442818 [Vespa mandarinia]|uniref:uncharacterized protein LOC118442818 n=1 Tax=Vespa mandarinia TaxID=7446 RepID=UPI001621BDE4|nr:uncharacterized protein LOC118442818 [Vespa mandarinia]XP_035724878.1 uncharacterized protein LOC118442818 [Vespa mandarinia]
MYSSTVTFFVSALCALLLPYYVVGELQILSCKKEDIAPGPISMGDINASGSTIKGSTMEVKEEINPSFITVHLQINDEDGDSVMEQNTDFCSMNSADLFKSYFESFSEPQFNKGNCPINPGTYNSDDFQIQADGGEGTYTVVLEALEGSNLFLRITCEAKLE